VLTGQLGQFARLIEGCQALATSSELHPMCGAASDMLNPVFSDLSVKRNMYQRDVGQGQMCAPAAVLAKEPSTRRMQAGLPGLKTQMRWFARMPCQANQL
jgi:hypothetical protein